MPRSTWLRPALRKTTAALAALATSVVLTFVAASPATATSYSPRIPFPPSCGTCTMGSNETLTDGTWLLKMQADGNLVMRNPSGTACWASNTSGHSGAHVTYQSDGNFVVYSGTTALWASNTVGQTGRSYSVSVHLGYFKVGATTIHGPC